MVQWGDSLGAQSLHGAAELKAEATGHDLGFSRGKTHQGRVRQLAPSFSFRVSPVPTSVR